MSDIDIEKLDISVSPGVNNKLQQEATLDRLVKLASTSQAFSAWLNTQGVPIMLENMDLNDKSKILESYEQYQQQMQQQAASKPPEPSPAQLQQQELDLRAKDLALKEAKITGEIHKDNADTLLDMHQIKDQAVSTATRNHIDMAKIHAENMKTFYGKK